MKHPLYRYIGKFLLSASAVFILILAFFQIVLVISINAFNTGRAHDFIEREINKALTDSGYELRFSHLFYDPVRGLTIRNAVLEDAQGPFLQLDRFSLSMGWVQLPIRTLDLYAHGGEVELIRLPQSPEITVKDESPSNGPITPFSLPDLYFKRVAITAFKIDTLTIGENVAGVPLSFSPHLRSRVDIGSNIVTEIILRPGAKSPIQNFKIPDGITFLGSFTPQSLLLDIKQLNIASDDYSIEVSGSGALTEGDPIDFTIKGEYPDLKPITSDTFESLSIDGHIGGAYPKADFNLSGTIIPALLEEKGLSDINFSLTSDNPEEQRATIKVETALQDRKATLETKVQLQDGLFLVETLTGNAPFVKLSGHGTFDTASSLFDGKLSISAEDLSGYSALLGEDLAGSLKIDATLSGQESAQSAEIDLHANKLRYQAYGINVVSVKVGYTDISSHWPESLSASLKNLSLADVGSFKSINASIEKMDEQIYRLTTKGSGMIKTPLSFEGSATLTDLTHTIPTIRDIALQTRLGASKIDLSGNLDMQTVDITAATKSFSGKDIPAILPDNIADLTLSGDLTMSGPMEKPISRAEITAILPKIVGEESAQIVVSAAHKNDALSITANGSGTGIRKMNVNAQIPMQLALYPFAFNLDQGTSLSGNIDADIALAPITNIFLPPTQDLSGRMTLACTIDGTIESPALSGNFSFQDMAFNDEVNGIILNDVQADGTFTQNMLTLTSLRGTDGENGIVTGQGTYAFGGQSSADVSVSIDNFHLPRSETANGILDASITMTGKDSQFNIGGSVNIQEMDIVIPETFQSNIPQLNIIDRNKAQVQKSSSIALSIDVNADNQIFVRGWGLDAEFGGDLQIGGNIASPQVNGTLQSIRGRYEEFGKRFALERANLRFQGDIPPSPYLDIEATSNADDVTASILLTGPVKAPEIGFSSSPALPEDEVLSRILFGRDMSKISPFQAVQLAQTLRRFSGQGGGFDALGQLRSVTGLDDISVDTDESGETNVGVGKYLTDKVYLEVERGKAEDSGKANIQIELTPSVNIQSEIGQDASAGGGIFWKRDY